LEAVAKPVFLSSGTNHHDLKITTKHEKCRTAALGGFYAGGGAGATFSYKVKNLELLGKTRFFGRYSPRE